jgi:hypothetical protein
MKRIIFWTVALVVIVVVAAGVFTANRGGEAVMAKAEPLIAGEGEGRISVHFAGLSSVGGFGYDYTVTFNGSPVAAGHYPVFGGEVTARKLAP